jgi:hypothetical protein
MPARQELDATAQALTGLLTGLTAEQARQALASSVAGNGEASFHAARYYSLRRPAFWPGVPAVMDTPAGPAGLAVISWPVTRKTGRPAGAAGAAAAIAVAAGTAAGRAVTAPAAPAVTATATPAMMTADVSR